MAAYIRQLHPWAAMIYLLMALVLVMTSPYDMQMALLFGLLSVNSIVMRGMGTYLKSARLYLCMIVFFGLFNMIFNPRGDNVLLYVNDRPLTEEALLYGVFMGFMVSALFVWFQIFQEVFDNKKIVYLIGSRLPVTGLILSMVFCYYEKFVAKIDKIREVWDTYVFEEARNPVKKAAIVLSVLLSVMLEDSVDTALSMEARGYGRGKRTSYVVYSFQWMDGILTGASIIMVGMLIWNPPMKGLAMVIFMLLPVMFCIVKELQWKFYMSRI